METSKIYYSLIIYLDVPAPIRQPSLGFQQFSNFMWIMAKLTLLIDQSLESNISQLTFYKRLLADIEEK